MSDNKTIDTLNTLIETCKDGEYGFRTSAEHAKSADLKSLFLSRSQDCQRGASELQAIVARLGGKAETDSSVTGTMHRGWVSVVGTLTGYSDQQMLDECERGEDAALERYRDALKEPLSADVMAVVQRQYEGVKRNHDQIRTLRNQARVLVSRSCRPASARRRAASAPVACIAVVGKTGSCKATLWWFRRLKASAIKARRAEMP